MASKFLFIGVGSIGAAAVNKAAEPIYEAFPDTIQAVIMDTDAGIDKISASPHTAAVRLNAEDSARAMQNRKKSPALDSWLPVAPMNPETEHGLFGCKFLGRLALVINIAQVNEAVEKALKSLKASSDSEDSPIEVFVCATLGGGTGAILPDLGYLIRSCADNLGLTVKLRALIPLSEELPEAEEATAANIYAGFAELNHWMQPGVIHTFSVNTEERDDWRAPEDENSLSRRDDSTDAIMANLDIFLADNVRSVNPGFKTKKDKDHSEAPKETKESKSFIDLEDSDQRPFDKIIFHCLDRFDGSREVNDLILLLRRFHNWSVQTPSLFKEIFSDTEASGPASSAEDPAPFIDLQAYQAARPTRKILDIIYSSVSCNSVSELSELLFRKDLSEDKIRGVREAAQFVKNNRLDVADFDKTFKSTWESAHSGSYYVPALIKLKTEEFRKTNLSGKELQKFMQELDGRLQSLTDSAGEGKEIFAKFADSRNWYIEQFKNSLSSSVTSIVNAQHNCIIMLAMLEELNRIFSFSLNALHERVNELGSETMRLEQNRSKDLESIAAFKPSFWAKLTHKVDTYLVDACFKSLEDYYTNKFSGFMAREEISALLEMLDIISGVRNKIEKLQQFLEEAAAQLHAVTSFEYVNIITGTDENLITVQEAADFIKDNTASVKITTLLEAIDLRTNSQMLEIPNLFSSDEWIEFVKQTSASINIINAPGVLEALAEKYSDAKMLSHVQQICSKLSKTSCEFIVPASASVSQADVPEHIFMAGFNTSPGSDIERLAAARLQKAVDLVEFKGDPCIIQVPDSEFVDFIGLYKNLRMGDFKLGDYKEAYMKSLMRGARFLHSRADVKLKAPVHIDGRARQEAANLLAQAFKAGVVTERRSAAFGGQESSLTLFTSLRVDLGAFKACLKLYEDPIDALFLEGRFLAAMHKWRSEQTERMGAENWLSSLRQAPPVKVEMPELASIGLGNYM
ncbi:hypothetical protein IJT93_11690 [bacterium]|nr:hypothetical protein [bacterium]